MHIHISYKYGKFDTLKLIIRENIYSFNSVLLSCYVYILAGFPVLLGHKYA